MKKFSLLLLVILSLQSITAGIKLPAIVSSNMVLQRNTTIVLWGWADAKEKVTITTSWLNEPISIKADKDGNWRTEIQTTNSKDSQSITLKSKTSDILLGNVLFGEVWLCSGQSNMGMVVKGGVGQPVVGSLQTLVKSINPNLRLFTVSNAASKVPVDTLLKSSGWLHANPENVVSFSATAYFYGEQLQKFLDVPVGLIHTSWGGSTIEAWMSKDALSQFQQIDIENADMTKLNHLKTGLFNAMINPLVPYTLKGMIWYQGESNVARPDEYVSLFPAMVKDWRELWGLGDFPFYYVQIAPNKYGNKDGDGSVYMREAQSKCAELIHNSGMVVTLDIGNVWTLHPEYKKEIGDRLLYHALNKTYGQSVIDCESPIYDSLEINGNEINLYFKHAENGLCTPEKLTGFEIAGEDKVFYPATAEIIKVRYLTVKSDKVPNPVAVRYAWRNWVVGSLFDAYMLPASCFRTDDWSDATRVKE